MIEDSQPFIQVPLAQLSQDIQPAGRSTVTGVPFGANKSVLFELPQSAVERRRFDLRVGQRALARLQGHVDRHGFRAFRQAFALCPSSPEAIFRYVSFLMQFNRKDDALLVAEAGLKADPENGSVRSLLDSIKSSKSVF